MDSADWHHVMIEAMKLAFADTYAYVGDPRSMTVTTAEMLNDDYLTRRAKRIDMQRASAPAAGNPPLGGTIYLSTADASGMMVSFIQSNYMGFGSGVVVPGYGISLQNRGAGFSLDPASPNCVAPGKRPFHTIIPGFLMKDGAPQMSFGVMGGNIQPQAHVQTLSANADRRTATTSSVRCAALEGNERAGSRNRTDDGARSVGRAQRARASNHSR